MASSRVKVKQEKVGALRSTPSTSTASSTTASESSELDADTGNTEAFEKRLFELGNKFPKGIPDKIIQTDMPALSASERAASINRLLANGLLDLYKQGNELLYKVKVPADPSSVPMEMQDADNEEKVVFEIIKEAHNKGIWIRDIRTRSNLAMPQLNKIVKSLENKKLIKAVKSVAAQKKKVFMLYDLEPHRALTGGAWWDGQDFESEFITVLNQQCYKYLMDKKQKAHLHPIELGPKAKMTIALATLDELWKYICNLGISKVGLSTEEIQDILNTLIYDGKVDKIHKGDLEYYMAAEPLVETTGITQIPCGVCPVAKDCSERGSVNPSSCIYLNNWLAVDF